MTILPEDTTPGGIAAWARRVMMGFGLADWGFGFDNAKLRLGCCDYKKRRITMSKHYVARNTPEQFKNTLLHEIAHALVGRGHGHDAAWRVTARRIGCNARRCSQAEMPSGEWSATCGCCGKTSRRHRRPKRLTGWYCGVCGVVRGGMTWSKGERYDDE